MSTIKPRITLGDLKLTQADCSSPVWLKLMDALKGELAYKREQNDHHADIKDTTLARGEIALVKKILALHREVGPEAGASEAYRPESQGAGIGAGIPMDM